MAPVRVDDAEREVESLRLLDRLIAGDDAAVPIDQHGAACAMVAQGLCERRAPTIGTAVGIVGVRLEIRQPERVTDGSCRSGHSLRLSAAIAASTTDVRGRATTRYSKRYGKHVTETIYINVTLYGGQNHVERDALEDMA